MGNGELTERENIAHFTLWCMMAAPLILGNDVRQFLKADGTVDSQNRIYQIVTNRDAIAIDQDPRGIQCRRIKTNGLTDVLVKPMADNEIAVCLFNKGPKAMEASFSIKELTELVARVVGYTGEIKWDTTRPNGTPRKLLDVSKATALGWTYKTELEEGIRLSYQDFLTNPMRAER